MTNSNDYWYVDIHATKQSNNKWMRKIDATKRQSNKTIFWKAKIPESEKKKAQKILKKSRVRAVWYKKEWGRASNYRNIFLRSFKGPYRCRYCNKLLKPSKLQVDHIVPIDKVKKSALTRKMMKLFGIVNVNDPRNLASACSKCNARKGNNGGIWIVKGYLGQFHLYWILLRVSQSMLLIFLFLIAIYIWKYLQDHTFLELLYHFGSFY